MALAGRAVRAFTRMWRKELHRRAPQGTPIGGQFVDMPALARFVASGRHRGRGASPVVKTARPSTPAQAHAPRLAGGRSAGRMLGAGRGHPTGPPPRKGAVTAAKKPVPRRMPPEQFDLLTAADREGSVSMMAVPDTRTDRLRNTEIDALFRKGMLSRGPGGKYYLTGAGRDALTAGRYSAKKAVPKAPTRLSSDPAVRPARQLSSRQRDLLAEASRASLGTIRRIDAYDEDAKVRNRELATLERKGYLRPLSLDLQLGVRDAIRRQRYEITPEGQQALAAPKVVPKAAKPAPVKKAAVDRVGGFQPVPTKATLRREFKDGATPEQLAQRHGLSVDQVDEMLRPAPRKVAAAPNLEEEIHGAEARVVELRRQQAATGGSHLVVEILNAEERVRRLKGRRPGVPGPAKNAAPKARAVKFSTDPAVREVQVENRVRAAYRDLLAEDPNRRDAFSGAAWVGLADLRDRMGNDVSRAEQDAALVRLAQSDGVRVIPVANTKTLTDRDRAAALRMGGESHNAITIDDPSPRSVPKVVAKKLTAGQLVDLTPDEAATAAREGRVSRPAAARHIREHAQSRADRAAMVGLGRTDSELSGDDSARRKRFEAEASRLRALADEIEARPAPRKAAAPKAAKAAPKDLDSDGILQAVADGRLSRAAAVRTLRGRARVVRTHAAIMGDNNPDDPYGLNRDLAGPANARAGRLERMADELAAQPRKATKKTAPKAPAPTLTRDERLAREREIFYEFDDGASLEDIATQRGMTVGAVRRVLTNAGVELPPAARKAAAPRVPAAKGTAYTTPVKRSNIRSRPVVEEAAGDAGLGTADIVRALDSNGATGPQLRQAAQRLGVDVPSHLRNSSAARMQLHLAQVLGQRGITRVELDAVLPAPRRRSDFHAPTEAERIVSLGTEAEIIEALRGRNMTQLRRIGRELNISLGTHGQLSEHEAGVTDPDSMAAFIARSIIRERGHWHWRIEAPPPRALDRLLADWYPPTARNRANPIPVQHLDFIRRTQADMAAGNIDADGAAEALRAYAFSIRRDDPVTSRVMADMSQQLSFAHHTPPTQVDQLVDFARSHGWRARSVRGVGDDGRWVRVELANPVTRDSYEISWHADADNVTYRMDPHPRNLTGPRQGGLGALVRHVRDTGRAAPPRPGAAPVRQPNWIDRILRRGPKKPPKPAKRVPPTLDRLTAGYLRDARALRFRDLKVGARVAHPTDARITGVVTAEGMDTVDVRWDVPGGLLRRASTRTETVRKADLVAASTRRVRGLKPGPGLATGPAPTSRAIFGRVDGPQVRPSLAHARHHGSLVVAAREELRRITGRDIPVYLGRPGQVSLPTAREHLEGVLRGAEAWPDADLREISWYVSPGDRAWARGGGGAIRFNLEYASVEGRRRYRRQLAAAVADWDLGEPDKWPGYHPRNSDTPIAIALHEHAHVVTESMMDRLQPQVDQMVRIRAAQAGILEDQLVGREIGAYARTGPALPDTTSPADRRRAIMHELVAEAMTDVGVNGDDASPLSREIVDLVRVEHNAGKLRVPGFVSGLPSNFPETGLAAHTVDELPEGPDVYYRGTTGLDIDRREWFLTPDKQAAVGYLGGDPGTVQAVRLSPSARIADEGDMRDAARAVWADPADHFGYQPYDYELADNARVRAELGRRGFHGASYMDLGPNNAYQHKTVVVWDRGAFTTIGSAGTNGTPSQSGLAARTVDDLRDIARTRGISIPHGATKADILALLAAGPGGSPALARTIRTRSAARPGRALRAFKATARVGP